MATDRSQTAEAIKRIKEEIETLRQQQSEALKQATYVGVSRAEAKEQENRRAKISKLLEKLAQLHEQSG
jgi:SMC interacting uncharacterized protein involved in chromosome segregation